MMRILSCFHSTVVRRAYSINLPSCDFRPSVNKGFSLEDVQNIRESRINKALFLYYKKPLFITHGHMQWLFDSDGNRFLDLFGGIVTVSVGHCHPKVNAAAHDQIDRLWHTTNIYLHPNLHTYAKKLTDTLPENLKVVYFVNSGSEANDMAISMARLHTGNYEVVSFRNGYHGASPHTQGLTANSAWRYNTPLGFGIVHAMNPDPYRGPWGGSNCRDSCVQTCRQCSCLPNECAAEENYIEQFREVFHYDVPKGGKVAAFFAESIQGVGGTVQYPRNFLKRSFEIVREGGGICVSDEVQTGFGRTGTHFWGFQGHGVIPDIVTMAKGIGNGFPLGAVVTTPEIAETMTRALHFNTYGGNPLASAIGSAVLDVIKEENLQQRSHDVGEYLLKGLAELRSEFQIIGDVRGKGLMIGVECVTDKLTRTPLPVEEMASIFEALKDRFILLGKGGYYGNVFRIKPPMCITKEDALYFLSTLREVLHLQAKGKL